MLHQGSSSTIVKSSTYWVIHIKFLDWALKIYHMLRGGKEPMQAAQSQKKLQGKSPENEPGVKEPNLEARKEQWAPWAGLRASNWVARGGRDPRWAVTGRESNIAYREFLLCFLFFQGPEARQYPVRQRWTYQDSRFRNVQREHGRRCKDKHFLRDSWLHRPGGRDAPPRPCNRLPQLNTPAPGTAASASASASPSCQNILLFGAGLIFVFLDFS